MKTYNKENGWSVEEQIKTEPAIEATKISDFDIKDFDNNEVTYEYLEEEGYHFMIVSHKMYGEPEYSTVTVSDTTFVMDTIQTVDGSEPQIVKSIGEITSEEKEMADYIWEGDWKADFNDIIKPIAENAVKDGHKMSMVFGGATQDMVTDLALATSIGANYYQADDILLKTIVRSNPGIVLWKDGKIIHKWHKKKLPSYEEIKSSYLK